MAFTSKIPLAWLSVTHDKGRLSVSLAGITFAVLLMFMQIGFLNALLDANIQLPLILNADIILTHKLTKAMSNSQPFAKRRLFQAMAFPGVEAAYPVRVAYKLWKNPLKGTLHDIRVIAFDADTPTFTSPEINDHLEDLKLLGTVMIDEKSKKHFGPLKPGIVSELEGKLVNVVGTFKIGTGFAASGNLILSQRNYLNLFKEDKFVKMENSKIEFGLLKISREADVTSVLNELRPFFSKELSVYTKEEFIAKERLYWLRGSPVGFVFGLGTIMGFIVGVIICYQILFTDIMDHLSQFATLKAIGYPDRYLISVVMKQAVIFSILGFLPGLLISQTLYKTLSWLLGLPMLFSFSQAVFVLGLTLTMCVISGLIAVRKVMSADPAELFS